MKLKHWENIFHEISNSSSNLNKKWNNKTCQCECKNYRTCTKDYSGNSSTCICEYGKYWKNIDDTSVILCDEIINFDGKNYIKWFATFYTLLAIILLFIIAIICYHYTKIGQNKNALAD